MTSSLQRQTIAPVKPSTTSSSSSSTSTSTSTPSSTSTSTTSERPGATDVAIDAIDGLDDISIDVIETKTTTTVSMVSASPSSPPSSPPSSSLRVGAKGPMVRALQEELLRVGQSLPRFGVDGDYGNEVKLAVSAFQMERRLPVTGSADARTMMALAATPDALPDYATILDDGVLQTTIAVGFDDDDNDIAVASQLRQGLHDRGFTPLDVANMTDAGLRARGLDPARIDRDALYLARTFVVDDDSDGDDGNDGGREVTALVKLVTRASHEARRQFTEALRDDEVVLYTGHGRRGSGPDFDGAGSAAGNVVFGAPYEAGHYALGRNDLDTNRNGTFADHYQLLFFDACTSDLYLDDLAVRVDNKNARTLDVIAATVELPWSTSAGDVFAVLDGVMRGSSLSTLRTGLDARNAAAGPNAFVTDRPASR